MVHESRFMNYVYFIETAGVIVVMKCQIREFVPKGWMGGHPNPKFLNRFLKNIQNALKHIINT